MKSHVKVFITKKGKIRAKIKEPDKAPYEVTVGGKEWNKGKGDRHVHTIHDKVEDLITYLDKQRADHLVDDLPF